MPQTAKAASSHPEVKAKLVQGAAIVQTDLTHFGTQTARRSADAVIQETEIVCDARGLGNTTEPRLDRCS